MKTPSQPVPLSMTIIDGTWLAEEISSRYSIGDIERCYLLRAHLSHFYIAKSRNKSFAVRVSLGDWMKPEQTDLELSFLRHLRTHGVMAVTPVENSMGEYFFEMSTADGKRTITVFEWINGIELDKCPSQDRLQLLGNLTAQMHSVSVNFLPPTPLEHSLHRGIHSWTPHIELLISDRKKDIKLLKYLTEKIAEYKPHLGSDFIPWSVVHGDLHAGNAMVSSTSEIVLLDFDLCGTGPTVYDIASYIWASEKIGVDKRFDTHFLKGYEQVRELTQAEKAALPILIVAKSIWWLALRARLAKQLGSTMFSPANVDQFFSKLRRDARNAALISNFSIES